MHYIKYLQKAMYLRIVHHMHTLEDDIACILPKECEYILYGSFKWQSSQADTVLRCATCDQLQVKSFGFEFRVA